MNRISEQFEQALLSVDKKTAAQLLKDASASFTQMQLIDEIVTAALTNIGKKWEKGDASLAQVYMSGRICEELVDGLLPQGGPQLRSQPVIAIAVLDDYHTLGKRIVSSVLHAKGFNILDYGRVTVNEVLWKVQADNVELLLLSVLMLNSALHVRDVVAGIRAAGLNTKVVVGGAPFLFDRQLWQEVEADAMGSSAAEIPAIIQSLTGEAS
ncbi:MAG: cobalamin-dependent protein [Dissulfurispiraceae bacterium]|jgi:methanogenic corrinoid protein MtbC1|nr:cobalamin-dependent protein [Dissulfurispiraceae bacterium]